MGGLGFREFSLWFGGEGVGGFRRAGSDLAVGLGFLGFRVWV